MPVPPLPGLLPLAVIEGLVDGLLPRHATTVALLAGPLVLLGYLVGSVPFAYLLSRRRLRRQLRGPRLDLPMARLAGPLDRPGALAAAALTAAATLLVATLAWDVALAASPGGNRFSPIGIYSNQAIAAWTSLALWTGLAAVVGNIGPPWLHFRGASGTVPAVALVVVYAPIVFAACSLAFLLAYRWRREPRTALLACLPVAVVVEYLAWLADFQGSWGVTNGPELSLWVTVLAATLFARNLRPRPWDQGNADDERQ